MFKEKGLTKKEAEKRLEKYGLNEIKDISKTTPLKILLRQIKSNFMVYLLAVAMFISFFVGKSVTAYTILVIIFMVISVGFIQEYRSEKAISALKDMLVHVSIVIRDGKEQEIDSRYLVPGDIFFLEEGTKIPADAKIIEERNLEVNEASLTGESLPVIKEAKEAIYMGTIASRGRGFAEVTATGMKTKFGQIAKNIEIIQDSKTPLQKKLESLTKTIGIAGISLSLLVFFLNLRLLLLVSLK